MLRKLIFVVCAVALTLASCGRQVTPDRTNVGPGGLPSGFMQIKFTTVGQLDFVNNWYVLAFNTSGVGGEPYAHYGNPQFNWKDWWYEIVVYQPPGGGAVQAALFQFILQPGTGSIKGIYPVPPPPQQDLIVNPNCNNQGTQFCVTINRALFNAAPQTSPTGSASPSATPSVSPSPTPSGSPSPSPSPSATPIPGLAAVWYVNWFVTSAQPSATGQLGTVVAAPGPNGINDTNAFQYTIDTTQSIDTTPWIRQAGWPQGPSDSATLQSGEIINNP